MDGPADSGDVGGIPARELPMDKLRNEWLPEQKAAWQTIRVNKHGDEVPQWDEQPIAERSIP